MACLITVKAGPIASCLIRELMVLLVELRILRLWKAKGTHWERHNHRGYRGERLHLHMGLLKYLLGALQPFSNDSVSLLLIF